MPSREHRKVMRVTKASAPAIKSRGEAANSAKHRTSLEKRVERTWSASRKLGWSYSGFVAEMLEVLIVLRQRERLEDQTDRGTELPQD